MCHGICSHTRRHHNHCLFADGTDGQPCKDLRIGSAVKANCLMHLVSVSSKLSERSTRSPWLGKWHGKQTTPRLPMPSPMPTIPYAPAAAAAMVSPSLPLPPRPVRLAFGTWVGAETTDSATDLHRLGRPRMCARAPVRKSLSSLTGDVAKQSDFDANSRVLQLLG